ncbi:MAG: hypothetical protein ABIE55_01335 [Candidatus Aenigmatarchaeota archaeon]
MSTNLEKKIKETIGERFSVLFQPVSQVPTYILKQGLSSCVKTKRQTAREIAHLYNRDHKTPVSAVRANTLLNELDAENSGIQIERADGKKYFLRVD